MNSHQIAILVIAVPAVIFAVLLAARVLRRLRWGKSTQPLVGPGDGVNTSHAVYRQWAKPPRTR